MYKARLMIGERRWKSPVFLDMKFITLLVIMHPFSFVLVLSETCPRGHVLPTLRLNSEDMS